MNLMLMITKISEAAFSRGAAISYGLFALAGIVFMMFVLKNWAYTSTNACYCAKDGHESVKINGREYFRCKSCGGLFEFQRGITFGAVKAFFKMLIGK